jgi:hypothetical protein
MAPKFSRFESFFPSGIAYKWCWMQILEQFSRSYHRGRQSCRPDTHMPSRRFDGALKSSISLAAWEGNGRRSPRAWKGSAPRSAKTADYSYRGVKLLSIRPASGRNLAGPGWKRQPSSQVHSSELFHFLKACLPEICY